MIWLSMHMHLGDLPTWVAAIAAIIAGYFGFGQLKALRTQNKFQQRDLDRQAEDIEQVQQTQRKQMELLDLEIRDRRAAQARQVAIQRMVGPRKDPTATVDWTRSALSAVAGHPAHKLAARIRMATR